MVFLPWHFAAAYILDLLVGDPRWWPHPIRWIGRFITAVERVFYDEKASHGLKGLQGAVFWMTVVLGVISGTIVILGIASHVHPVFETAVLIWLAFTTLATRNLHQESVKVAKALGEGNIVKAREKLAWIVSRDTSQLEEQDIVRALVETVSENISDGIVAPLFYLSLGGPVAAMAYKAMNTMDSMVGYMNDRYRYFGWFAARADDLFNWIPARLSGLLLVGASAIMRLDWRKAWNVMRRDARKMKSPNAGYPEAAAAGALNVQLGGTNIYFGRPVEKPTLGDAGETLSLDTYRAMIRLMYLTSALAFFLALGIRTLFVLY
ncbi:adenosylcobinamide-phosphate synthase CbiB [Desulforhabdus amnigena]|uniref:Cobalamin biosynthesis protein CobD n=1 Tax=Desulforhabdus amnigena TaxID=40218 RepID=A0A9W6FTS9_9BACT|nr:adenosylcobinamide-phosphate synthase CbiB [Desulforhabdus amnigena]NLJ27204.1 cobalamin biosynthesis protein CobD [Deltaproteobacteria bacterium]GLI34056.1 cobalamin biosynthesis protein CbiB [Desulforhabdus amnigena]